MTAYSPRPPRSPRPLRPGFTLPEMLIALVLFSLVGGSVLSLMMRQQRFHRSTAEVIKLRGQLRQASSVLPTDLRGISTSEATNVDIYARSDASIDFRRVFGSSLVCAVPATNVITLYPSALDAVPVLTTWAQPPVLGDSLLVLDEGKMISVDDDTWRVYEVRAVAPVKGNKGCPWKPAADVSPLLTAADTLRTSYRVGIDPSLAANVRVGAPVRLFRRTRYQSFRAGDGKWYLGYADCLRTHATASLCSDPTPASGPYQPQVGNTAQNGIVFTYFDSVGNALASTDPSRLITRVDVVLRAMSTRPIARTGSGVASTYSDSLLLSIGIRNFR